MFILPYLTKWFLRLCCQWGSSQRGRFTNRGRTWNQHESASLIMFTELHFKLNDFTSGMPDGLTKSIITFIGLLRRSAGHTYFDAGIHCKWLAHQTSKFRFLNGWKWCSELLDLFSLHLDSFASWQRIETSWKMNLCKTYFYCTVKVLPR